MAGSVDKSEEEKGSDCEERRRPMKRWLGLVLATVCLLGSGCLARQVAHDGKDFRHALLDMYTDQVMDNLIRARCGQAFVQLAYRDLLVQDLDSKMATVGDQDTRTGVRGFDTTKMIVFSFLRTFSNQLNFGGSDRLDRTMSFHADPVTDKNDIYELYLAFSDNPSFFVVTDTDPGCAAHIKRKCSGKYYWVPVEAGRVFQQLVLATTFMRGQEAAPPLAYEVTVTNAVATEEMKNGVFKGYVEFDQPVPNGEAVLTAKLPGGRTIRLPLSPYTEVLPGEKTVPDPGQMIKRLQATWNTKKQNYTALDLNGAKGRVFSVDYPPPPPKSNPDLQQLQDNLDQIRLQLNNLRSSP
jgi:hypothetical protein